MIARHTAEAVVKALVLQNEVANLTLDAIEEAVLRTDINGGITYLNRMAEKLTGWCRDEDRLKSVDAGVLRHPTFGNRDAWSVTKVQPGFFSRPVAAATPAVSVACVAAMREALP